MISPPDLSHQKLRGRSFKGQDLTGANFSGADIRGADFSYANLTATNFTLAQSGQQLYSFGLVWIALLFLMLLSGLISGYSGGLIGHLLFGKDTISSYDQPFFFVISGALSLIVLGIFIWASVRKSLGTAFGSLSLIVAVTIATAAVIGSAESEALVAAILHLLVLAAALSGAIVGEIATTTGLILVGSKAIAPTGLIFIVAAIPGALEGVELEAIPPSLRGLALLAAGVVTLGLLGLSLYIGRLAASRRDNRYVTIQKISSVLASFGGTRFCHANLTDADFTEANLKNADLRAATLKRTYWFRTQQLHCARLEGTCLENPAILHLVVTQNGQNQNYDYLNLRGLNLQDAHLEGISLIGADLSESTFQNTDLSKAKLVKTQLYGVNLTGACLTGAFIQDWAIATDTLLNQVNCEYVYMRLPTSDNPDAWRKPDNRDETFKAGDFSDFIAPIVKTLNLYRHQNVDPRQMANTFKTLDFYHYQGIDPGAAAIALKQLAEQYPEAGLEVVALEGRGEEKVRLQAIVADAANQSQLSSEYFEKYRQISALPYQDIQALLSGIAEKDKRICSLERMVESAIKNSKFYVETYYNMGDNVSNKNSIDIQSGGNIGDVSGLASGDVSGIVNLGTINGHVNSAVENLPKDSEEKSELKTILKQLQLAIEAEPTLTPEDKVEALEQVQILAEAGKYPEDEVLKKTAKTAIKIIKGTITSLPDTASLVESGAKLLPEISTKLASSSSNPQSNIPNSNPVKPIVILFLAADPTDTSRLRLGTELREIQESLQIARLRENFRLEQRLSVRPTDITQALLDQKPRIVHFSGHGTGEDGLCFENESGQVQLVKADALATLFGLVSDQVDCVLLNACYSKNQAEAISDRIKYVIGMTKAIGDSAAISFSIGFYQAIGAGRSVKEAYKFGCVQIGLQGIPEHLTPVLLTK